MAPASIAGSQPLSVTEPSGSLSLADATALTLARSPELEPADWDVRIREAAAIQAASRPNPELSIEVENAAGSGQFGGFDAAETTLSIGQTIELGRKRQRRMDVAARDVQVSNHDRLVKRAEVLNAMARSFYDALAAQLAVAFADESHEMQKNLSAAQGERLEAGKLSESEVESAKAALALAGIEADSARSALKQAKQALAAHWGNSKPRFARVGGSLNVGALPLERAYRSALESSPVLGYATKIIERQRASVALEEANRVPDVTAGVGARRFEESDDGALVFQLSIPLPLFDRNRGNIEKARAELGKARAERESVAVALESTFSVIYEKLAAAHREAAAIEAAVLPSAERGYRFASEGYELGKFSYLELKTAQATLIEARQKLVAAQLRFHKAKADLEALVGQTH